TDGLYDAFSAIGVDFGPTFHTVERLTVQPGGGNAWLQLRDAAASPGCHPTLLDGALQACVAVLGSGLPAEAFLPLGVERFVAHRPLPARLRAELRVAREAGSLVAHVDLIDEAGIELARLEAVRFAPAATQAADDWLHEVVWHPVETPACPLSAPGAWLLLADTVESAEPLAEALRAAGAACACALAGVPDAVATLDDKGWQVGKPLAGVALLALAEAATDSCLADALHIVQALVRRPAGAVPLVIVTLGAQPAGGAVPRPSSASLWGLGSTIAVEHPELALRLLDLDPDAASPDWASLAAELGRGAGGTRRLAWRGAQAWTPRLQSRPALPARAVPLQLVPGASGTLDGLRWQTLTPRAPAAGELRLRVVAAGVNFRDVLMALGMIPGQRVFLGAECAGFVQAVGPGVAGFQPGDAIFGFAPGSLSTEVTVPAAFVAPWPGELGTLERAASLPVAYLTAMVGLQRIAGLRAGQSVLIHAAAGGVGMAAVRLALRAGARVFATAGSPAKRELLRGLGVAEVFDSRTLDFAAQVRQATGGGGVDVVLNSLAGDFIGASVEALAADGCFLELGKRDLWPSERFAALRPGARYEVYDLGTMALGDPGLVRPLLDELVGALREGSLLPLPLRVFDFALAGDAFRVMAQARHTGKLALRMPISADIAQDVPVHADASYLITGGLGALGLHAASWLVQRGARHLMLLGRHAPSARATETIAVLQREGAQVRVHQADVADSAAMRGLLDTLAQSDVPL
ncbi:MAG: KR domain-containing protein, partial [Rhodocyclaceae bacterium]